MQIIQVTEANFEDEVINRSDVVPVVVVLWSPRSEVCVELLETLSGLAAADNGTWALAAANVDAAPGIARIFGVQAVPTVVALAAAQPVSSFQGPQPADQLRRWIDSLLEATAGKLKGPAGSSQPEEVDPVLVQARQELEDGDFAAARESYQAILDADPGSVEAAGRHPADRIPHPRNRRSPPTQCRPPTPHLTTSTPRSRPPTCEILNQDVTAAFGRLIALVRRTSGDERTKVRTRLIELFELFDPADPEVVAGRRNLANALY